MHRSTFLADMNKYLSTNLFWLATSVTALIMINLLSTRNVFVPKLLLQGLWYVSMIYIAFPIVAKIVVGAVVSCLLIFLLEIISDEIRADLHLFDPRPAIGLRSATHPNRELIACVRSSNNGYGSRQFYPATICDTKLNDDPFSPNHASTIYCVEIRRRSAIWRTINIWQVSMLNGGQKKIHAFNHFCKKNDGYLFAKRYDPHGRVKCFQSAGVIFIAFGDFNEYLHIYDTRYKTAETFNFIPPTGQFQVHVLSISCLGRLIDNERKVVGWQIRMIDATCEYGEIDAPQSKPDSVRACLFNVVFELGPRCRSISLEEIVFGNFSSRPSLRSIRTGHGFVGLFAKCRLTGDGPTMVYDPARNSFLHCANYEELVRLDQQIEIHGCSSRAVEAGSAYEQLCPVFFERFRMHQMFRERHSYAYRIRRTDFGLSRS